MSVIGIMSLPIFAYLLVQGVEHTASIQRYILTVLVFAVISEVPYDLATSGQVWDWSSQNSLWTVFVALVMLWLDEVPYDEIAAITGLSRNNVASKLHRIRIKLREQANR